ncbi:MFS transporter [Glycomyces endophyticus]|uniref:MFS transporter n=1 Tax=Glycomyces endophyticus TaxID=480996 RepID=A0ABP4SKL1_9ACTN
MRSNRTAALPEASGRALLRSPAIRVLRASCVAGGFAQSLTGTAGVLLAVEVTGSESAAGLPQTVLVAGSAVAATAASRLSVPFGRRRTLAAGAAVAAAGSTAVAAAALTSSLALVLIGCALLGAGTGTVMLGRYAAAELVPEALRPKAMASILAATTIGAVAGPNLLAPASLAAAGADLPGLAGPFLFGALAFAITIAMLLAGRLPDAPPAPPAPSAATVPARFGPAAPGLAVLALSNLVMVGVSTMAPVHLGHHGGGLGTVGLVVSAHVAAMFAPSVLSAHLVQRLGAARTAALAGVVMSAACVVPATGTSSLWALGAAMVVLGAGWNLGLVSGSAMLTASLPREVRVKREGMGEAGMGAAAAAAGLACGPLAAFGGYVVLAMAGAVVAALIPSVAWSRKATGPAMPPAAREETLVGAE